MVSDSGCEVRSRAHAGRSSRRPVWPCRRRFNKSNRRLPAGILRLVPRRLCDRATHGSVRRCHCILSKTSQDGVEWGKAKYLVLDRSKLWTSDVRTPLGLIPEDDGTFTLFCTGYLKESRVGLIGGFGMLTLDLRDD